VHQVKESDHRVTIYRRPSLQALQFLKNHADGKMTVHKVEGLTRKSGSGDPKACAI